MPSIEDHGRVLADEVLRAQRILVFTGAGLSTESGIPDYRSSGGIWTRMQPIEFGDFVRSAEARRESWRRVFEDERGLRGRQPNAGHEVLAHWTLQGRVAQLITQNVDGLHQAAGVPEDRLIELHGNAGHARCLECGRRYEFDDLRPDYEQTGQVRPCSACGGLLKIATISFGQPMPVAESERAQEAAQDCDLFLALGSSLRVYPAAALPETARTAGARLLIVNREPTPLDALFHRVIHAEIGPVLAAADRLLQPGSADP